MPHITAKIVEAKAVECNTRPYLTRDGYTKRSGAPTQTMIRFEGEKIWRRLMVWQFSNSGTCFVRVNGECLIVPDYAIPDVT